MTDSIFEINKQDIVHEIIDGEAILINMATGSYYSLDGSGAAIWEILQSGAVSMQTIVRELGLRYQGEVTEIQDETLRILDEMQVDGLVLIAEQDAIRPASTPAMELKPFESPILTKYTDLEALLLLDPIHDVSSEGWPNSNVDEK